MGSELCIRDRGQALLLVLPLCVSDVASPIAPLLGDVDRTEATVARSDALARYHRWRLRVLLLPLLLLGEGSVDERVDGSVLR